MILERVEIVCFGALADRALELAPGLNVILGPNEAGKSTLFQAVRHALFTPSRLTKPKFQSLLSDYLPLGGGDTLACTLQFRHRGLPYRLSRRWGQDPAAELVKPDGSRLAGEEAIRSELASLLPAGEGTMRSIFLTGQYGLTRTLEELREDPEAVHSLSDLLHRAVLETDGVSVARFRARLEEQLKEHWEHWDLERERPEENRGADRPWVRGVGRILEAWYEREGLARSLADAEEKEKQYDLMTREREACRAALEEARRRVERERPAAQAAWERRSLEADRERTTERLEALQAGYDLWPQAERGLEEAARELPAVAERAAALERELAACEAFDAARDSQTRLARVRELKEALEQAREKLRKTPALPRAELAEIERDASDTLRLEAGAGLTASFRAQAEMPLVVQGDEELPMERTLHAGETLELRAQARMRFSSPSWSLEARSEPGEPEQASLARKRLKEALAARGLSSLEEARQACFEYERLSTEAEQAEAFLQRELEGESYEDLERAVAQSAGAEAPPRERRIILEELLQARERLHLIQERQERYGRELEALKREHGSREALLEKIVERAAARQELEKRLASLPALPPGVTDPEEFLRRHGEEERALEELQKKESALTVDCARVEENLPEESAEELRIRLTGGEEELGRRLRRGKALLRIRAACDRLLEEREGGSLAGFERALAVYVGELTEGRYGAMLLEDGLPEALVRQDGQALPYRLLSAGTRDLFALALRLAMAETFLAGKEGFLILDDPLVDLDPRRQAQAAAVLERFAAGAGRQLLLFTCHPAHAERFPAARRLEL